jgi:hypothetical protein
MTVMIYKAERAQNDSIPHRPQLSGMRLNGRDSPLMHHIGGHGTACSQKRHCGVNVTFGLQASLDRSISISGTTKCNQAIIREQICISAEQAV